MPRVALKFSLFAMAEAALWSASYPSVAADEFKPEVKFAQVPANAELIAARLPFVWLTFYEGGHAFLFQSYAKFGVTVNLFLK